MRVFIAAASRDVGRAQRARAQLALISAACTARWIDPVAKARAAGKQVADYSDAQQQHFAEVNRADIMSAGYVWALAPARRVYTTGFWPDVVFAIDYGIPTLITGPTCRDNIYCVGAELRSPSDDDALAWLVEQTRVQGVA